MENCNKIVYSNVDFRDPLYLSAGLNNYLPFERWISNKPANSVYIYRIPASLSNFTLEHSLVRNTQDLYILYDNCLEGYTTTELERLHEYAERNNLKDKFIFLSGNRDIGKEYSLWRKKHNLDKLFRVCYNSNWYYRVKQNVLDYNLESRPLNKSEWFMCLNNRLHTHRAITVTYMDYLNILEKGKVTCLDKDYERSIIDPTDFFKRMFEFSEEFSEDTYEKLEYQATITKQKLPLNLDTKDFFLGSRPHDFNPDIYNNTLINVVTETYYYEVFNDYSHMFLSEKIWKPIAMKQMFILIGPRYGLKYLRDLGFKTFSNFIDESYDELDTSKRIFAAIESLKTAMETYTVDELNEKTKEIRTYNFNHLMSASVEKELCKPISSVLC